MPSEKEIKAAEDVLRECVTPNISARGGDPENYIWRPHVVAALSAAEKEREGETYFRANEQMSVCTACLLVGPSTASSHPHYDARGMESIGDVVPLPELVEGWTRATDGTIEDDARGDIIEKLRGKLAEMELHDDLPDSSDIGYMACWREISVFLNDLQEQSTGTGSEDLNRSQPKGAA